jgi:hypothetical protein
MKPIVARCGNRCDLCPLFTDNFAFEEAAKINAGLYKYHHASCGPQPHHVRGCDGCLGEGYVARARCAIRACALERQLATCAQCSDMYCELLEHDMNIVEAALTRHKEEMSQWDFDRFFRPFLIREALARLRHERESV